MNKLRRHMGLFHLTMYGVGLILGAGIYVLIGEAAGFAGDSVWMAFILGSIVALFAGLSYAELSSIFPQVAAEYIFVKNVAKIRSPASSKNCTLKLVRSGFCS